MGQQYAARHLQGSGFFRKSTPCGKRFSGAAGRDGDHRHAPIVSLRRDQERRIPSPVKIGVRAVAFPSDQVHSWVAARRSQLAPGP